MCRQILLAEFWIFLCDQTRGNRVGIGYGWGCELGARLALGPNSNPAYANSNLYPTS